MGRAECHVIHREINGRESRDGIYFTYIAHGNRQQPETEGFTQNRLNNSHNCAILKSINQNYGGKNVKADRACKLFFSGML